MKPDREFPKLHNYEAEQALLGALLVNNDCFAQVGDSLGAHHFFEGVHARIYETATTLIRAGKLASPKTIIDYFTADASLEELGGSAYIACLAAAATTILNAKAYAGQIIALAQRREVLATLQEAQESVARPQAGADFAQFINHIAGELMRAVEAGDDHRSIYTASAGVEAALTWMNEAYKSDGRSQRYVATGLASFDGRFNGLLVGKMSILGGRPAMGKSIIGWKIAANVARHEPVGFISAEMEADELYMRQIAADLYPDVKVAHSQLARGRFDENRWDYIVRAADRIKTLPILTATGSFDIDTIAATVMRFKLRHPAMRLVVLDYLGLIKPSGRYAGSRVNEVSEISAGLVEIAKRHQVHILALHQLSRDVERRDDKRPQLADLRDSGSLEQDAYMVMFVYREEYYLARKEPKAGTSEYMDWQDKIAACKGVIELGIEKHRGGSCGRVMLGCDLPSSAVWDLARQDASTQQQEGMDL